MIGYLFKYNTNIVKKKNIESKTRIFLNLNLDFFKNDFYQRQLYTYYVYYRRRASVQEGACMSQLQLLARAEHWALGMATVVHHLALGSQYRASTLA